MLPDVQSRGKDLTSSAQNGGFLPYSHCVLTKANIEYAAKYLNESDEARESGLKVLREFLMNELGLQCKVDDSYLLCFLRSRKCDIKRTISLMRKGAEFLDSNGQLIERVDSLAIRRAMESRVIGFLPYRDSKGRAMLFIKADHWEPSQLKAEDIIFGSIVTLHSALDNPVNQVSGFVVIVDFKNLRLQHIIAISSWIIFGLTALQRCCPCLVKEIHVVHTPAVFRGAWKVTRAIISDKIKRRITFHKSANWDSLHRKIPPAILPEELGGLLGPFSNDHWTSNLGSIEKKYYDNIQKYTLRKKPTT